LVAKLVTNYLDTNLETKISLVVNI